jgi:hypothetical protein
METSLPGAGAAASAGTSGSASSRPCSWRRLMALAANARIRRRMRSSSAGSASGNNCRSVSSSITSPVPGGYSACGGSRPASCKAMVIGRRGPGRGFGNALRRSIITTSSAECCRAPGYFKAPFGASIPISTVRMSLMM